MRGLSAIADALSAHPEEPMSLGVLLGLCATEPAVFDQAPEIPERAARGEYGLLIRLIQMGVAP
ncbi:hypothetical protein [Streptomyces mirabilis]|uniref:hypothetical protein n=1 Tax=Streptomyces mirabilis TaxID=68239 RepID=UPI00339E5151